MCRSQMAFEGAGKFIEGIKCADLGVTDGVTGQPKVPNLIICDVWFCCALQPYQMEISHETNVNHIWDTSKSHPKVSVSIFEVSHSRS